MGYQKPKAIVTLAGACHQLGFLELCGVLKSRVAQIESDAAFPLHFPRVFACPLATLSWRSVLASKFMALTPPLAQAVHVSFENSHEPVLSLSLIHI